MSKLPTADLAVLAAYVLGVVGFGCYFVRRSRTTDQFMAAGRSLPGWAVGLSVFGTYLSSNTFLGVPGKAYGSNWSSFVFSLSLPLAALVAVRFFVPFYRRGGGISAYEHLEHRFGPWARTYAVICYLLTQVARTGSVLFGVSLALSALTGWPLPALIIATGVLVTLYTLLGGIEAVIWTDVVQSVVLTAGAGAALVLLLVRMPGGPGQVLAIGAAHGKFGLGGFGPSLGEATFWVVLLYGLFINLNNFGIDQSYVQRYHAARSDRAAARSVWMAALLYLPVSLVFFVIGSCLFAYYQEQPDLLRKVTRDVAAERLRADAGAAPLDAAAAEARLQEAADRLTPADVGDKVFPHFIVEGLPTGFSGLLIAAILAAAMSSIDTSLNSSATVILSDLWKRYVRPGVGEAGAMRVLHVATLGMGALGTAVALAMIGVQSVLDAWWTLSGIFAGGLLGLFLLGLIVRRARRAAGLTAVVVGLLVILWMSLSPRWPEAYAALRSPFHANMVIVIGTLTIFLVGLAASRLLGRRPAG